MRALLDVSLLLALMDSDHIHHQPALAWWDKNQQFGWASCPLTQNGFIRISSQRSYAGYRTPVNAIEQLRRQTGLPNHEFWPDDVSLADNNLFDRNRILGPKQLTDIYLLGLAAKHGGRLATFDRTIPLAAVRAAQPKHLAVV